MPKLVRKASKSSEAAMVSTGDSTLSPTGTRMKRKREITETDFKTVGLKHFFPSFNEWKLFNEQSEA